MIVLSPTHKLIPDADLPKPVNKVYNYMKILPLLGAGFLCASCVNQPKLDLEIAVPKDHQYVMAMRPASVHLAHVGLKADGHKNFLLNTRDYWVERCEVKSGHLSLKIPAELYEEQILIAFADSKGSSEDEFDELFVPKDTKSIRISEKGIIIEKK